MILITAMPTNVLLMLQDDDEEPLNRREQARRDCQDTRAPAGQHSSILLISCVVVLV
jgi:hypothetical protein